MPNRRRTQWVDSFKAASLTLSDSNVPLIGVDLLADLESDDYVGLTVVRIMGHVVLTSLLRQPLVSLMALVRSGSLSYLGSLRRMPRPVQTPFRIRHVRRHRSMKRTGTISASRRVFSARRFRRVHRSYTRTSRRVRTS